MMVRLVAIGGFEALDLADDLGHDPGVGTDRAHGGQQFGLAEMVQIVLHELCIRA